MNSKKEIWKSYKKSYIEQEEVFGYKFRREFDRESRKRAKEHIEKKDTKTAKNILYTIDRVIEITTKGDRIAMKKIKEESAKELKELAEELLRESSASSKGHIAGKVLEEICINILNNNAVDFKRNQDYPGLPQTCDFEIKKRDGSYIIIYVQTEFWYGGSQRTRASPYLQEQKKIVENNRDEYYCIVYNSLHDFIKPSSERKDVSLLYSRNARDTMLWLSDFNCLLKRYKKEQII